MRRFLIFADKIWRYTNIIATIFLAAIVFVIILNIIMRRFFNMPIFGSTEIIRYCSLGAASFALCQNEWFEGNVKMTILTETLSKKKRQILDFIVNIICTVAFMYISYLLVQQAIDKFVNKDVSIELNFPLFIAAGILAGGVILLTICILIKTISNAYSLKTGENFDLRTINEE